MGATSDDRDTNGTHMDSEHRPSKKRRTNPPDVKREVFWPQDLLPQVFPQARILTWGYNVQLKHMLTSMSKESVFQYAGVLLSDLALLRTSSVDKQKNLVFIAHSLGGIVVKDALSRSRNETTWIDEILPATIGVIFLGTPHHGSKKASLAKQVMKLAKTFYRDTDTKIIRALEEKSDVLERVTRGFGQVLSAGKIKVHSFQEADKTNGMMIVEKHSSAIGYLDETSGTIHADHRNMAKFRSDDDRGFKSVVAVLHRWLEETNQSQAQPSVAAKSGIQQSKLPDGLIFDEIFHREYEDCVKSLDIAEARDRLRNVRPAYKETYSWLFDSQVCFRRWLIGKDAKPIFWIYGKPGSGKSTLMKFAMTHQRTRQLLEEYDGNSWKLAGYFFHDRGTDVQKSIEGFLSEILYQILVQDKECFYFVYSVYAKVKKLGKAGSEKGTAISGWTQSQLQEATLSIASRSTSHLNLCLFIDALDEHDGNHKELISTLIALTDFKENPMFKIRLCVAGRPENVFKDAFRDYPSFAIHDYTETDIRLYAEDRIRHENNSILTDEGKRGLQLLVTEIVVKARGVFLWVRLVVDEIIEGLTDGKTLEELQQLLSEIPEELEDLYTRAIRRVRRVPASAIAKNGFEVYVMFQIALFAQEPFTLFNMLVAARYLTIRRPVDSDIGSLSDEQMENRLNRISSGLLEATHTFGSYRPRVANIMTVQFIHQTVKEFMLTENGGRLIRENIGDKAVESGNILIFRYILAHIGFVQGGARFHDRHMFALDNFYEYGQAVELSEGICAATYIETSVESMQGYQEEMVLILILVHDYEALWAGTFRDYHSNNIIQKLLFYTLCDLPLSLTGTLESYGPLCDREISLLLLKAAFFRLPRSEKTKPRPPSPRIIRILLDRGVRNSLTRDDVVSLERVMDFRASDDKQKHLMSKEVLDLWGQFLAGVPSAGWCANPPYRERPE